MSWIGTAHRIRTVFVINMTRKTAKGMGALNWHERLQARKRSREHKRVHRRRRRGTAYIFGLFLSLPFLPSPPSLRCIHLQLLHEAEIFTRVLCADATIFSSLTARVMGVLVIVAVFNIHYKEERVTLRRMARTFRCGASEFHS